MCRAAGGVAAALLTEAPAEPLAVTGALGECEDWPAPWRKLPRAPRRHPVPGVRGAAPGEITAHE
ncbi:hypothetical protein [Streptomyces anthocyanicus]|uniref:hypothetical protein n=1 Tax=Streptomyces anthocyanicus TaxID=68174 RepID=UPI0022436B3C|nr:hypothetical protein [Streptomyces anthocyanicus]MCW8120608.1 hypothetical protein [Streptomyces anthocyanicus]